MGKFEYLKPYEKNNEENNQKSKAKIDYTVPKKAMLKPYVPESPEAKAENKRMINALNKLVPKDAKYGTYKYENPKNPKEKYNVGVQKVRKGFSVLLMDPQNPKNVLKGVFELNKKPEFFQLNMEKQQGITKKENQKKMPSNPQVVKNFMAIVGEVNKIELTKKQGE